jgi:predicted ABC-type ATPase
LYYIGLNSLNESLKRIKNRVEKGGHYIDKDTVTARYEKRFAILERILPFCDEIMFFDNENGFVKVAEYRNGELTTIGAYYPDWLGEFRTELNRVIKRLS